MSVGSPASRAAAGSRCPWLADTLPEAAPGRAKALVEVEHAAPVRPGKGKEHAPQRPGDEAAVGPTPDRAGWWAAGGRPVGHAVKAASPERRREVFGGALGVGVPLGQSEPRGAEPAPLATEGRKQYLPPPQHDDDDDDAAPQRPGKEYKAAAPTSLMGPPGAPDNVHVVHTGCDGFFGGQGACRQALTPLRRASSINDPAPPPFATGGDVLCERTRSAERAPASAAPFDCSYAAPAPGTRRARRLSQEVGSPRRFVPSTRLFSTPVSHHGAPGASSQQKIWG